MDDNDRQTMSKIVMLKHGALKEFALTIKGKLTRSAHPSDGDFTDAVFDAALELMADPEIKAPRPKRSFPAKS